MLTSYYNEINIGLYFIKWYEVDFASISLNSLYVNNLFYWLFIM
jgi:hypothetical protein